MRRYVLLWLVAMMLVASCTPSTEEVATATSPPAIPSEPTPAEPTPEEPPATEEVVDAEPTASGPEPIEYSGLPLPAERGEFFAGSGLCAACHSSQVDEAGTDVSIDSYWRATMMANAARDPYWQATVRAEVEANPALREVIEDKCSTCHMPMARTSAFVQEEVGSVLDAGFTAVDNNLHELAMDGVSCTLCHQISTQGLGAEESFGGGFVVDTSLPEGERPNYGPYETDPGQAAVMQRASGYLPVFGEHMGESELCATCHTLYTPYVDAAGEVAGVFPEQMAFFEWGHSSYDEEGRSCQGCHMPEADGAVLVSGTGGEPRTPFYVHSFVGGNAFMLRILQAFGAERQVTASPEQFEATIGRVHSQLQSLTASVGLEDLGVTNGELAATVVLQSRTGHKFPTGFPSRRAWIHFVVRDSGGEVVFESGGYGEDGVIVGNDNDSDPASFEPHYLEISEPDQVQIYETVMVDTEGEVTTTLLRGAGYVKDNRLLPAGFDKAEAGPDFGVYGAALEDEDFVGGGDRVVYLVDVGEAQGPFRIEVELLYQSVGYRWADNLRQQAGAEIELFGAFYDATPNEPVVVANATAEVAP